MLCNKFYLYSYIYVVYVVKFNNDLLQYSEKDFSSSYNSSYIDSTIHYCVCRRSGILKWLYIICAIKATTIPSNSVLFSIGNEFVPRRTGIMITLHATNGQIIVSMEITLEGKLRTLYPVSLQLQSNYSYVNGFIYI